ncbi:MAG TPA: DUF998 domain-containing protein [Acidimicrobiia bacterium]
MADIGFPDDDSGSLVAPNIARRAAIGGVIGPIGFVTAWLSTGFVKARYSLLYDPISDLAGAHASTRPAMTAGFVVLAVGMCFYARALHSALAGLAWITAAITGLATLGVAAFPLHHSSTVDSVHGTFAGIGYVTLAATALVSAAPLYRRGLHEWARTAAIAGVVSAIALALTLTGSLHGLFQRIGLTAGDVWVVASGVAILRGSWTRAEELRT